MESRLEKELKKRTGLTKEEYIHKTRKIQKDITPVIDIIIPSPCNIRCKHCYLPPDIKNEEFDKEEIKRLIEIVEKEGCMTRPQYTEIFVGDIEEKLDLFRRLNETYIITNGLFFRNKDDMSIKNILEKFNVSEIEISLHLLENNHNWLTDSDSFQSNLDILTRINKLGYKAGVFSVLTDRSLDDIPEFCSILASRGIPSVTFIQLMPAMHLEEDLKSHTLSPEDYKRAISLIEDSKKSIPLDDLRIKTRASMGPNFFSNSIYNLQLCQEQGRYNNYPGRGGPRYCQAGNKFFVAAKSGKNMFDIYPCHLLILEDMKLGQIDINKRKITFDKKKKEFFERIHEYIDGSCKECDAVEYCGGGCFAHNYLSSLNKNNRERFSNLCYTKAILD